MTSHVCFNETKIKRFSTLLAQIQSFSSMIFLISMKTIKRLKKKNPHITKKHRHPGKCEVIHVYANGSK